MKPQFTKLITLFLCLFFISTSIQAQGIKWVEGLNWEQVKAKAKAENKYIFVDCHATWCGPCKQMDKEVYPLDIVGEVVNEKFIAVKIQMDSTNGDSENVKKYYSVARTLEKLYSIAGFPTYLFFSPDGEIVNKAMGFQNPNDLIHLAKDVLIPEKQLYTQIKAFREGKMDNNLLLVFIQRLNDNGDKEIALELARLYMKNHLEILPESRFLTKENLKFMNVYQKMILSDDRIFKLCYKNPKALDSIYKIQGFAEMMITNILFYDIILPEFGVATQNNHTPNWHNLKARLKQKSDNSQADRVIFEAEHAWYIRQKEWDKACEFVIIKFQRKELKNLPVGDLSFYLNEPAWTLFLFSFKKKQLEQGLLWVDEALALDKRNHKSDPGRMDTKANLLYKLGRKKEAIELQSKIFALNPSYASLGLTLEKMKLGKPTWPTLEIGVKENKRVK